MLVDPGDEQQERAREHDRDPGAGVHELVGAEHRAGRAGADADRGVGDRAREVVADRGTRRVEEERGERTTHPGAVQAVDGAERESLRHERRQDPGRSPSGGPRPTILARHVFRGESRSEGFFRAALERLGARGDCGDVGLSGMRSLAGPRTVAAALPREDGSNQPSKCAHCGLPLPAGGPFGEFCCAGCRAVRALLDAEGLDRFYELGGARGRPVGAVPAPGAHEWLAEAEARGRLEGSLARVTCDVQGIHCAACVWLLQELWRRTPGAVRLDLNPSLGRADVTYSVADGALPHWIDALERLGYRVGPAGKLERRVERSLLVRLGIAVALALNAMMFACAEYFGLAAEGGSLHLLFRRLSFGIATAAVLVGGPVFFRAAFGGLRRRVLHLDLPISLGILLAWGSSTWAFFTGSGASYFDTVTVFVALMLLGRYLQRSAVQRNQDYLLANDGTEHVRVKRLDCEGHVDRVPVHDVRPGDVLLVAPGDLVPVDARLLDRSAAFSLDWISGESRPRAFEPGDALPAGAFLSARRAVRVGAVRTAADSGLERLLATPVRADDLRGRGRFWDLVNRGYVAAVLLIALAVAAAWLIVDPSRAAEVTTAVLVVTCPCALGLATPLAFDLALAALRRRGVFVREPSLLEKARHVRRVVFDKTGTLTWGGVRVRPLRDVPIELRDALFTMVSSSNHPVSRAIGADLAADGARFLADLEVEEHVGEGVRARLANGDELRLGGTRFTLGDAGAGRGHGLCTFTRNGHVDGCWEVAEDYRSGAAEEVAELRARGHELYLVSGDRGDRVVRAGEDLGFGKENVFGAMDPEAKADLIARLDHGDTLMIGDGLNDAPAFEAAFCAGTPALDRPVLPARADFFYTGIGTGAVARVLATARRFHRVVTVNLTMAVVYNVLAVGLAAAGTMTPVLCAVLMPSSSLVLIGYTALAMRHGIGEDAR